MSTAPLLAAPVQQSFAVLDGVSQITVKQKVSKIEALTAMMGQEWYRPNKYKVVGPDGEKLFSALEQTGCCRRQLFAVFPACMSWEIKFSVDQGGWVPAFDLYKPWQCTCLCFNLPRAYLTSAGDHSQVFGYMQEPCCSCFPHFRVYGSGDELLLAASTSGCQPGLWFPFPCGPCAHITMSLRDAEGNDMGSIDKEIPCGRLCSKYLCPGQQVDNYRVDLSKMQDPQMKALAMALAVFIDFRYMSREDEEKDEGEAAAAELPA